MLERVCVCVTVLKCIFMRMDNYVKIANSYKSTVDEYDIAVIV